MVSWRKTEQGRLDEVYKMVHGLSSVPVTAFFQLATNSCTRGHSRKLVKAHCSTDIRLHFFSHRVLSRWNSLSQDTVYACWVLSECLQTASGQDSTQQNGLLYGLVVRITLLAAAQARAWLVDETTVWYWWLCPEQPNLWDTWWWDPMKTSNLSNASPLNQGNWVPKRTNKVWKQ